MENKKLLFIWVAIALLLVGVIWAGLRGGRTVVVDQKGNIIQQILGAISGPDYPGPYFGINGLQEHVVSGDFKDATTTIVSFTNPNTSATGTIEFLSLRQTGLATSTFDVICGTDYRTSAQRVGAKVANVFFDSPYQSTSTSFFDKSAVATSTSIYIGPSQSFMCVARGSGDMDSLYLDGGWDNAFVNNGNTFTGSYKVKIYYPLW